MQITITFKWKDSEYLRKCIYQNILTIYFGKLTNERRAAQLKLKITGLD